MSGRRIETSVRQQRDIARLAKASGDDVLRREAQANITGLQDRYEFIMEKARHENDRISDSGFRPVKTTEQLKGSPSNGIIEVAGQTINPKMRAQKQQEHVWGAKAFVRRTEAAKAENKPLPSAFYQDVDIEKLVKEYMGKGIAVVDAQGVLSEYFSAENNVGLVYLRGIDAYDDTSRVCIRYSKVVGTHSRRKKQRRSAEMHKLNPDSQKIADIEDYGAGHWVRVHCKDGTVVEGAPDCWTYMDVNEDGKIDPEGDDEVDAMLFVLRDGSYREIAGIQIDHFEILEAR